MNTLKRDPLTRNNLNWRTFTTIWHRNYSCMERKSYVAAYQFVAQYLIAHERKKWQKQAKNKQFKKEEELITSVWTSK